MDKKVLFDSNKKQKQKSDNRIMVNIWPERTKTKDDVLPKFNRYQFEQTMNTFPIIPLSGYTASDPTNVSFFHNDGTFFSFMIAALPILFSIFFLVLGSQIDFKILDDLPFLLPFKNNYII